MNNATNDWAASLEAVATSTSYEDYLAKMARAVLDQHFPTTDHTLECWWHEPARGLYAWHAEDEHNRWLGNAEWVDGTWVVTYPPVSPY